MEDHGDAEELRDISKATFTHEATIRSSMKMNDSRPSDYEFSYKLNDRAKKSSGDGPLTSAGVC